MQGMTAFCWRQLRIIAVEGGLIRNVNVCVMYFKIRFCSEFYNAFSLKLASSGNKYTNFAKKEEIN